MKLSVFSVLFCALFVSASFAQQQGPQGVLVSYCLGVAPVNGSYQFTNNCSFVIEVAAAQPHPNGQPNGSDTFQLFPRGNALSGTTSLAYPRYWACSAPNGPRDATTHATPKSDSNNVVCPRGGGAGAAR
jgi:hypothetical protein